MPSAGARKNVHGSRLEPKLITQSEPGFAGGAAALVKLVAAGADAIFFAGDVLAIGAVLECQRRGWTIPDRVAIASFDDHEIAVQMTPALTTLKLPRYEIGRRAAKLIVDRNNAVENAEPAINDLGFEVIARQST